MEIKKNINKLHSDLLVKFKDVAILEKSDKKYGNYFEISINENNKNLKVIIPIKNIESIDFNWKYFANPLNESSTLVDRHSNVNHFIFDIVDIFEKNRFDSDYLEKLS